MPGARTPLVLVFYLLNLYDWLVFTDQPSLLAIGYTLLMGR